MLDGLVQTCLLGTGAFGATVGIGCSYLVARAVDANSSSYLIYGLIGGTLGALTSYTLVIGGAIYLLIKVMQS
ncbi:Transmembrane domain-containing protein [Brazilian cedratvirus IHUMI]|uniref:Transmembrane domain-containing protein n=1 Tax=Brazilian cedratvirus IHUMI TaxID=2126980 RepID=A0A2R8FDC6_9VIRU|nr:Transmembrane domain-containing protein [Brazilian cedratvirus IHUMI]